MSGTSLPRLGSLAALLCWCKQAPGTVTLTAADLAELLEEFVESEHVPQVATESLDDWRVKLWSVHEDVRLNVHQVCEALGRKKSWVYGRAKDPSDIDRLPARRLAGELTFRVGDLRRWIQRHEQEVDRAA